ncbi:LacI family DNA-binding transcriptional regulator [Falsarthrobacter nasiphocae]|uniref:DNA-binding LacI/PurR family transcriptional regulator n=1 Tax=Falsarthrobacter nasiphocae TaxID=189863 RepID=A0AAE3YEL8_9MICC|nr:LacI family DNA-binding transcriptional regulator [Falsarthrobacter nasiphocae]MDR6892443.1 DNA-binding LacI/PurR family transcriptional regulator [Falsarthrobacter nasiphocae]
MTPSPESPVDIREVARAAGVATSTVSRALRSKPGVSDRTRERIRRLADELGYTPTSSASGLASGRSRTIGVLVPTVDRWFFSTVMSGMDLALAEAGYDLMTFSLGGHGANRQAVFDRALRGRKIDGLVVAGFPVTAEEEERLRRAGIPVVVVGHGIAGVTSIAVDEAAVLETAVDHLAGLGHTEIGFVHGALEFEMAFEVPTMRLEGFRAAMARRGLPVREEWLPLAAFTARSTFEAVQAWLNGLERRPTAIVASSDEMGFGAAAALRACGLRVPQDVSVIGIDDHAFSEPFGLTTVRQDAAEHGRLAALHALSRIGALPAGVTPCSGGLSLAEAVADAQPHELIVRSSTAAVSA